MQFLSLFDAGTAQTEREDEGATARRIERTSPARARRGRCVACSGSLVEVYAKAPVIAQVKGMLSTPGWWAPATRLADAQREDLDLDFSRNERDESESAADADADADAGSTAARSLPPWIVAHAEAGFCAARALDFEAACSHWRRGCRRRETRGGRGEGRFCPGCCRGRRRRRSTAAGPRFLP